MSTKYYRFGFGSGSLASNFKGLGSVQVHRFEILKVRAGSGSMITAKSISTWSDWMRLAVMGAQKPKKNR